MGINLNQNLLAGIAYSLKINVFKQGWTSPM